jgi:hypothetical protein
VLIIFSAAAVVGTSAPLHAADTGKMLLVNPQTAKFITVPGLPTCATVTTLRGDPRYGPAWVLLKLASGCRVPWHWHTPNEDLVVISGQGNLEMKDGPPLPFVPGAYASLPSHHVHRANCTRACLLFDSADGPFDIHYVDANGQEISMEQAVKQSAQPTPKRPTKKKKVKK